MKSYIKTIKQTSSQEFIRILFQNLDGLFDNQ